MLNIRIGVLALQGDFEKHLEAACSLSTNFFEVRNTSELKNAGALIIPGGESSSLLKLMDSQLKELLINKIKTNMPVLSTCAGTILLAKKVLNPAQDSLKLIDIEVQRNAYGRQVDSWVENELKETPALSKILENKKNRNKEGVFIRAPKITFIGDNVDVLLKHEESPVLVKENNILAATFHPELSGASNEDMHATYLTFKQIISTH